MGDFIAFEQTPFAFTKCKTDFVAETAIPLVMQIYWRRAANCT